MSFRLPKSRYSFQAQPDIFVYTNPSIANESLPAIAPNLGLEPSKTWKELLSDIKALNERSSETKEHYKLVFAARHGQGDHNVAEDKYGTKAWDDHWSLLSGDGQSVWGPDPHLTELGEGQAREARAEIKTLLNDKTDPMPLPTAFFASPLIRSAKTLELTFEGIVAADKFKPTILECVREDFKDRHTCDQRSRRSEVGKVWEPKGWTVDPYMSEEDDLFHSDYKETKETMTDRLRDALSFIFDSSVGHDVINITSHSGAMQSLFRAVNTDDFKPKTGGWVSLLVKATEHPSSS